MTIPTIVTGKSRLGVIPLAKEISQRPKAGQLLESSTRERDGDLLTKNEVPEANFEVKL